MPPNSSRLRLLVVPYDSGNFDTRMGAGPLVLLPEAERRLRAAGHAVAVQRIDPPSSWLAETQTAFELQRELAAAVRESSRSGEMPLLLSGNCNVTLGVLAGLQSRPERVGLVWLDAHADFNTPETTGTGFLDGQGLAMIVGRCWSRATQDMAGFTPIPERDVLLLGARDVGAREETALRESEIVWLPPAQVRDSDDLSAAIETLARNVDAIHIHIDLDVHDPEAVPPANSYAAPAGLSAPEVQQAVRTVAARIPVVSAALAAFDPEFDVDGRMLGTALDLIDLFAREEC